MTLANINIPRAATGRPFLLFRRRIGYSWVMTGLKDSPPCFRDADKRTLLQTHYLFSKLSPKQIDRLAACIVGKSVPRGTSICAKGDPGSSLFVVCQGMVKISVPSADGHDAVLNLIGKGDVFGEIALLDGRPRSTDVVAITDCELFVIERRDFLPLVKEEPEIALKIRHPEGSRQHHRHVAGEHEPAIAHLGRARMGPPRTGRDCHLVGDRARTHCRKRYRRRVEQIWFPPPRLPSGRCPQTWPAVGATLVVAPHRVRLTGVAPTSSLRRYESPVIAFRDAAIPSEVRSFQIG